ncbi:MAG: hypothetical protein WBA23_08770 [Tunicatimonas sp.]|uniref:hypothetical protein n=1 Tax=Tunicatimonas sp. TaxID=1940096 RepID=UPI003C70CC6B
MKAIKATYNGKQFLLDEDVTIPTNSRAIIVMLDEGDEEWYQLARSGLNRAYSSEEPEYDLSQVEPNKNYEGR